MAVAVEKRHISIGVLFEGLKKISPKCDFQVLPANNQVNQTILCIMKIISCLFGATIIPDL